MSAFALLTTLNHFTQLSLLAAPPARFDGCHGSSSLQAAANRHLKLSWHVWHGLSPAGAIPIDMYYLHLLNAIRAFPTLSYLHVYPPSIVYTFTFL